VRTSAPSGVTFKELSANYVNVYVDKRTQKGVEIRVNPTYRIESGYTLGTPFTNIEAVTVSGPADVLEQITHAQVSVDVGNLVKSVTKTGSIVLYSGSTLVTNPYVKVSETDVTVTVPVYAEKDVPLSVAFKYGYFNEKNSIVTIEPSSVRIKGDPTELDKISTIELMTLDEKKLTGTTSINMAMVKLPDTVENLDRTDSAVITVTHLNTATRVVNVRNISVKNPNGLEYTTETEDVNITLRGSSGSLSLVSESNISLEVDLSYYKKGAKRISVPVKVILPESLQPNVYELGEYTIDYDIK
jgi:YbbR domain-containing protein